MKFLGIHSIQINTEHSWAYIHIIKDGLTKKIERPGIAGYLQFLN